jgi:hypothetical protein
MAAAAAATLLAGTALAQVPYPDPGTVITNGQNLFSTGGDIKVTFLGKGSALDTDLLYYGNTLLFNNQTNKTDSTYDLGVIPAGTLLTFTLYNETYGEQNGTAAGTFYTGQGFNNPDYLVHAYVVNNYPTTGSTYVGFEDLPAGGGGDFNYSDVQFYFTGVSGSTAAPEPSTLAFLGAGLAGLGALRRRQA